MGEKFDFGWWCALVVVITFLAGMITIGVVVVGWVPTLIFFGSMFGIVIIAWALERLMLSSN